MDGAGVVARGEADEHGMDGILHALAHRPGKRGLEVCGVLAAERKMRPQKLYGD